MRPTLFGVEIPEAAKRVVIRPVLGPGGAQPMYEARFEVGAEPTEKQVRSEVARDVDFWGYVEARVKAGKLDVAKDGDWSWRLRLQFYNQLNSEETILTDGPHEFYRSTAATGTTTEAQGLKDAYALLEKLSTMALSTIKDVSASCATAIEKTASAASTAVGQVVTAAGTALGEASKQTAAVSELTKALHEETGELKTSIFALQTERAKGAGGTPQSETQALKEAVDAGKMIFGLAESLIGPAVSSPAPTAAAPAETGAR